MYGEGSTSNHHEITEEEEDNISQAQISVLQAQQHQYQSNNPVTALPLKETGAMTSLSTESGGNINHEGTILAPILMHQAQRSVLQAQQHQYQSSNPVNPPPPPLPLPRFSPHSPQEFTALTPKETDHVTLFVAYDGEWECDNKEWIFNNSKGSMLVVPKHIRLWEMTEILYKKFRVNRLLYRFKLEVHWTRSSWFPVIEIRNDLDLSMFISESSKKELPLCVTRLVKDERDVDEERRKDYANVFVAYNGKWERGDKGERIFKNFESSTIFVPKHITLPEITDILYEHLDVNKESYRITLEIYDETKLHCLSGKGIHTNSSLSRFISETSKTKLLLCVTRDVAISSHVAGEIRKGIATTIYVAYNGKWEYNGEEWLFKNSKRGIILDVSKHITLSEITNILNKKLGVDEKLYRLKLEVHYRTGSPWFPIIEIQDNIDFSQFISETSKTKVPLCVTRLDKDYVPDVDEEKRRKDDDTAEKRLLKAIWKNDWVKAREIVNNTEEVTWTSQLDDDGNTAFHFAVGGSKANKVVRDIINALESNHELLENTVNKDGETPAHIAALYGNTEALKIMLGSNPKCLFTRDIDDELPICSALELPAIKTFQYLYNQMKNSKDDFDAFFRSDSGGKLSDKLIDAGLIDVAYMLINHHRDRATKVYKGITPLERIIRKPDLFYSGTDYNLYKRFVYRHVPIENNSFGGTDTADTEKNRLCCTDTTDIENNSMGGTDTADVENQETPKENKFVTKHTRMSLQDVISKIWVKLWKSILLHVPHVKHLKEDKVKHNTTIKLLRLVCKEIKKKYTPRDIHRVYTSPFYLSVENDTVEAIEVLATSYNEQLEYVSKKDGQDIFQLSVLNRSEKVYSYLLHNVPDAKILFSESKDDDTNNILHLAGRLAPIHKLNVASGAALQMQQELQWFEEVEKVVPLAHTRALNKNKETPMMVFRREHEKLRKEGEEWMKKTADSYTITAALIITIIFAAAITVPGGNDSATGKPIYETKASLIIFAISDAISLFTSTTSLLLFLSILTARYADDDFLYKLPKRLILGLVLLFVSVTSMMIAFGATLYIMFGQEKQWILIPIGALACLPIVSFLTLQIPLLVELISSTYGPGIFAKGKEYWQSSANANKEKRA